MSNSLEFRYTEGSFFIKKGFQPFVSQHISGYYEYSKISAGSINIC